MLRSVINGREIEDVMSTEFPKASPEDRISDVTSLMRKTKYYDVPVIDNGEYVGVLSYGTMLKKGNVSLDTKIQKLVSKPPTVSKGMSITDVAEMMISSNSRQLAVLNSGGRKVVGTISRSALLEAAAEVKSFREIKVWELMSNPVESIRDTAMLDDALEIMTGLDIRTVPVVDSADRVVGIVGMNEVTEHFRKSDAKTIGDASGSKKERAAVPISTISATAPKTVNWDDDIGTAARIMIDNDISTLPVLEGEELVGILTQYDIVELISACREREVLYVQISGLDDDDKAYHDSIYDIIGKEVEKIAKISKPSSLTMHVAKYNEKGENNKYSITARLSTDNYNLSLKEVGWDLIRVVNDLMKRMTSEVVSAKDARRTYRRRKR
jgi:CBS domain-containing protein